MHGTRWLPWDCAGPEAFLGRFWGWPSWPWVRQAEAGIGLLVSESATTGLQELPFSQPGRATFCASSPGSCGHRFPMLLDPVLCSLRKPNRLCGLWVKVWDVLLPGQLFDSPVSCLTPQRKSFIFFFSVNGCVPLSTEWGETMNPTPTSRAGKAHLGKTQSQVFADYLILSMLFFQVFLSPHDLKILVIYLILCLILKRTCGGSFGLWELLSKAFWRERKPIALRVATEF